MALALILDGEARSRALLAAQVRRVRGMSVVTAGTLEEASVVTEVDSPDILITRWELPDGLGCQAAARVCAGRQAPFCVVYVLREGEPCPEEIERDPSAHVLREPVSSRIFRKLLKKITRETLDGQPLLSPAEYLQLLCIGGHSAVVECSRDGRRVGQIDVVHGEIWTASDEQGDGVAAFQRLVRGGSLAQIRSSEEIPERTIEGHWEHLLLEAARLEDEETGEHPLCPAAVDSSDVGLRVDELMRAGARAVLRRDLEAAARHFEAAAELRPDDELIRHNLERLRVLGYIGEEGT